MAIGVYVARSLKGNGAVNRLTGIIRLPWLIGLLMFCSSVLLSANFTANVYAPSAELQKQFIADTTSQYQATVAASPYFANTYTITLSTRYPTFPVVPVPSTPTVSLDAIVNKLTTISTYTYVVGYAQGMLYERQTNAETLGWFMTQCSTVNAHDFTICNGILGYTSNYILNKTSGIAVVPNPPIGF